MLKSLRIRNYRAFRELRIDELSRINLVSGRNNSGKTTLLEALLMLSAERGHWDPEHQSFSELRRFLTNLQDATASRNSR